MRGAMEIHISIHATEPLAGTATAGSRAPLHFEGWLELLRVFSSLVGLEGRADPGKEPTEHEEGAERAQ